MKKTRSTECGCDYMRGCKVNRFKRLNRNKTSEGEIEYEALVVGNHKWDTWFVGFVIGLYALCFDSEFFSFFFCGCLGSSCTCQPATFSFIIIIRIRTQISIYWIKFRFQSVFLQKDFLLGMSMCACVCCLVLAFFVIFYFIILSRHLFWPEKPNDPTTGFLNQNVYVTPWTSITLILRTLHT